MERRASIRFPLVLRVLLNAQRIFVRGRALNISSGGALIVCDDTILLSPGTRIEAKFDWPVKLGSGELNLVFWGKVIWTRERLVGMKRMRYEFRVGPKRFVTASAASMTNRGAVRSKSAFTLEQAGRG
jgi:hypothetical protein